MSKFNWRFRKSYTIIPYFLKFTLAKKSWSVNFRLGPYSRSWGSMRSTSNLDMPGEYGFFLRKNHKKENIDEEFNGLVVLGLFYLFLFYLALILIQVVILPLTSSNPISINIIPLVILLVANIFAMIFTPKVTSSFFLFLIIGTLLNWFFISLLVV